MTTEERLKNLEVAQGVLEHKLKANSISDKEFKKKVIEDLEYLKERDIKVMTYIEGQLEKEADKKEIRQAVKAKLATSGIWGVILLLCAIGWYALTNWIKQVVH